MTHRLLKFIALLITTALVAGAAKAQVLVIGSKAGKACYTAALHSQTKPFTRETPCTDAIKSRTLDNRDLAATYINRGIVRMRNQKIEGALSDYEEALKLRPNKGAIYLNRGAAHIAAGDYAKAIPDLKKALDLDTQDAHAAHYNLGLAYELTGDVTSAYYAFQKALDLRPDWQLAKDQLERFTIVSTG